LKLRGTALAGRKVSPLLLFYPVERILENALGYDVAPTAAAEKRDLLARLLARVAHEIRNPLSSLNIHIQLLEEDLSAVAPEIRQPMSARLEIIQGELHRLESIVSQFVRLAGPSALDLEPVHISTVVGHVCDLMRPEAASREIQLDRSVGVGLPPVMADPVRLTQALLNLVINALQAVERGGRVMVNATVGNDAMVISVADSGPGIPPEKLPSIFDPYFTTKAEGHGLGLWIAQQIALGHGGTLRAQSGEPAGAVFVMTLPLTAKSQTSVTPSSPPEIPSVTDNSCPA
jgi:signal transduction histidine kinase